jgi:hypothetical protein
MDVNEVDELRDALRRADLALAGLRNALIVERELRAEVDRLRADLARYTAVYGDPNAPVDVASFAVGEPDAPQIKVGDHVRCETLGNLTGVVETVNPSDRPGWDQCFVRDDREGHVWVAAAFVLEVIP